MKWPRLFVLAALLALNFAPANAQSGPSIIKWKPIIESSSIDTDQIFPAEIISLAARHAQNLPPTYLGDANGVFGVAVVSSIPDAQIRVTVKVDKLADESSFEVIIPEANKQYEVWPTIRFDTRALARIREPFTTTALFSVSLNGISNGEQSRTIKIRSVNDVPFARRTRDGHMEDLSPLFAAFVDENHPYIDRILQAALKANAVQRFKGYQGTPQDVVREVFAVWNVLQREGVKYSNITTPSGESQTVLSQHVRFLDEAIQNTQANCVDGSVLFASVLYKLGIYPVLVLVPGHMYLGFYTDGQRQHISFLETTLVGEPGLNSFQRNWTFKTADGYLSSESYRQFTDALNAGSSEFQKATAYFQAKTPRYLLIDIEAARRFGISPIGRF